MAAPAVRRRWPRAAACTRSPSARGSSLPIPPAPPAAPALTWNPGSGQFLRSDIDDVGFIGQLIAELQHRHAIDPQRVYVAGMSIGGALAYQLACSMSDRLAAVGVVAGVMMAAACHPAHPVFGHPHPWHGGSAGPGARRQGPADRQAQQLAAGAAGDRALVRDKPVRIRGGHPPGRRPWWAAAIPAAPMSSCGWWRAAGMSGRARRQRPAGAGGGSRTRRRRFFPPARRCGTSSPPIRSRNNSRVCVTATSGAPTAAGPAESFAETSSLIDVTLDFCPRYALTCVDSRPAACGKRLLHVGSLRALQPGVAFNRARERK